MKSILDQFEGSLAYVAIFIGILILTIIVALLVSRFFRRLIRKSSAELQNDPTNYQFLRHALVGVIYMVGFGIAIYAMPNLRALASSLLAGAGILAVAIGFASQHALSNVISGVFIVIFRPFRVRDRVEIRDLLGIIEDITLRHTVIRDFENQRIIIPNSVVSDEVIINSDIADDKICKWVEVGISYDSDIDLARSIMQSEVMKHPSHLDNRTEEQKLEGVDEVIVRVVSLGDFSVTLRAWAWSNNSTEAYKMKCDLLESIKKRFDREGVEIPFPYRTLVFKNPEQQPKN